MFSDPNKHGTVVARLYDLQYVLARYLNLVDKLLIYHVNGMEVTELCEGMSRVAAIAAWGKTDG